MINKIEHNFSFSALIFLINKFHDNIFENYNHKPIERNAMSIFNIFDNNLNKSPDDEIEIAENNTKLTKDSILSTPPRLFTINSNVLVNISKSSIFQDMLRFSKDLDSNQIWVCGTITNISLNEDAHCSKTKNESQWVWKYTIKLQGQVSTIPGTISVYEHDMAQYWPLNANNLPIGTRVVIKHPNLVDDPLLPEACTYRLGTVLEPKRASNMYRYLVIFDDWYVFYVGNNYVQNQHDNSSASFKTHNNVGSENNINHLYVNNYLHNIKDFDLNSVCCSHRIPFKPVTHRNGNKQLPDDAFDKNIFLLKFFLHKYLATYPDWAMVHLKVGQTVNFMDDIGTPESPNAVDWAQARVIQLDASLAKLQLLKASSSLSPNKPFWVHRGSVKLEPIFTEQIKHIQSWVHGLTPSHHQSQQMPRSSVIRRRRHAHHAPHRGTLVNERGGLFDTPTKGSSCTKHAELNIFDSYYNQTPGTSQATKHNLPQASPSSQPTSYPLIDLTLEPDINSDDATTTSFPKNGNIFENFYADYAVSSTHHSPDSQIKAVTNTLAARSRNISERVNHIDCDASCRSSILKHESKAMEYLGQDFYHDLAKPLLGGWDRKLMTKSLETNDGECVKKSYVHYVTPPCLNRRHSRAQLDGYEPLLAYLRATDISFDTIFTLDQYCFNPDIRPNQLPLTDIVPRPSVPTNSKNKPADMYPFYPNLNATLITWDISNGKELSPISCIIDKKFYIPPHLQASVEDDDNEITILPEKPAPFTYNPNRRPEVGVYLDTDRAFLPACTCTDGFCADPRACSCRSLTIISMKKVDDAQDLYTNQNPNNGYYYKRLEDVILTGIYECNVNCPCHQFHCFNRVVQNGLGGARMQVFKDELKGWCGRTLDDIPEGAFISTYSGLILSDEMTKERGDEYFADLDFIECFEEAEDDPHSSGEKDSHSSSEDWANNDIEEDSISFSQCQKKLRRKKFPSNDMQINCHKVSFKSSKYKNNTAINNLRNLFESFNENFGNDSSDTLRASHSIDKTNNINNIYNGGINTSTNNKNNHNNFALNTRYWCSQQPYPFVIDAKKQGNIGRFFSHSCDPNMQIQNVFVDTHNLCFPWICFFATRNIRAGEELTWDYCYEINSTEKEIPCHCKTANCRKRLL